MTLSFHWKRLSPRGDPQYGSPCARSSHGVSVLLKESADKGSSVRPHRLFVIGGEHVARTPLVPADNQMAWSLNLDVNDESALEWKFLCCTAADHKQPPPRVAHAQAVVGDKIYIFGGRAGIDMQEQAMNDMWVLDCCTDIWSRVEYAADSPVPEARSFHRMLYNDKDNSLYVFGGCGAISGRLNDLHRFDVTTRTWHDCASKSLLRGRGGPNFFLAPNTTENRLAVVAGFAGEETNDGDLYDCNLQKWVGSNSNKEDLVLPKLRPRSVCVSASFPSLDLAVIFGGEVDPSERGHEGAGGFANDIVVLGHDGTTVQETIAAASSSNNSGDEWPEERGWSSGASVDCGDGTGHLFVFGGLAGDDTNPRRLHDLWRLDVGKS